jgi:hypothetical protein
MAEAFLILIQTHRRTRVKHRALSEFRAGILEFEQTNTVHVCGAEAWDCEVVK